MHQDIASLAEQTLGTEANVYRRGRLLIMALYIS